MKKIKLLAVIFTVVFAISCCFALSFSALAETDSDKTMPAQETVQQAKTEEVEETDSNVGSKAYAAAIVVAIAAAAGAIAMGIAIAKSNESIARQPEAAGKINSTMMLGLVFIETLIIYALIVAILIIFVM